jgi:glycosyltransferase involved in cell wall biosynthesis
MLIPPRVLRELLPLLRRVQIIHFHDIDLLPWMTALCVFKPVVYDIHENYAEEMLVRGWIPNYLRRPLKWFVMAWHAGFPWLIRNLILAVPHQENEFRNPRLHKLLVYNYASQRLLESFCDDYTSRPNRVIFTGSHYEDNGSILLLEIAHRMQLRNVDADIWVTDRFASMQHREMFERGIIQRKLRNLKIIPSVPSSEIMQLLAQATIGISPNLRIRKQELAIPTKLFEYMAAALPIVTSDLPYQRDLIMRHNAGLVAQPENPDSFVSAIQQLVNDRLLAESLGKNGQVAFKNYYTWEAQLPHLMSFYGQIISKINHRQSRC